MNYTLTTRQDAVRHGQPRYYTGKPCRHGHDCERITSSRKCVMCNRVYQSKYFLENDAHRGRVMSRLAAVGQRIRTTGQKRPPRDPDKKRTYCRNSYKRNPIPQLMRTMLRRTLLGKKIRGTREYLGYDCSTLKQHITEQLRDGMSWSNYGKWQIDHIKPVAAFLREGVTDPGIIHALSNLQPLWAEENNAKGSL